MCGINGVIGFRESSYDALHKMSKYTARRGPDRFKHLIFDDGSIAVAHDRLIVLDRTELADQPLVAGDLSHVLVFNGEIYNFRSLNGNKDATSDTVELLTNIVARGINESVRLLNGMFAFAYVDGRARKLYLARDGFGQKPIYYWCDNTTGKAAFSSDINSVVSAMRLCGVSPTINDKAVSEFFRLNYVGQDRSIFEEIKKVRPGEVIELDFAVVSQLQLKATKYFDARQVITAPVLNATTRHFTELFDQVIRDHLVADVPVGCFLSGGLDSTAVAISAVKQAGSSLKTFSVGYDDVSFDEGAVAARTAESLRTDHHVIKITEQDLLEFVDNLHLCFPEPFSDSSQIACFVLAKNARKTVTVALTGDAGDEVFGGYNRYVIHRQYLDMFGSSRLGSLITRLAKFANEPSVLEIATRLFAAISRMPIGDLNAKMSKVMMLVNSSSTTDFYTSVIQRSSTPKDYMSHELLKFDPTLTWKLDSQERAHSWWGMRNLDLATYLPDDNLQKVDRCSMFFGLECRVPFLDIRLKSYADSLGPGKLVDKFNGKLPVRDYVASHLPVYQKSLVKSGFSVPMKSFVFPALEEWIKKTIAPSDTHPFPILNRKKLSKSVDEFFCKGDGDVLALWDAIVFCNFENRIDTTVSGRSEKQAG